MSVSASAVRSCHTAAGATPRLLALLMLWNSGSAEYSSVDLLLW